jgi:hypothetical protein
MDGTTDGAVAEALRAARSRIDAERLIRRPVRCAERRRRIVAAAGNDADDLSEHVRRVLDWLAGWDEPTIDGGVDGMSAMRSPAGGCIQADADCHAASGSRLKGVLRDIERCGPYA